MTDMTGCCVHFTLPEHETRDGRRFFHSDPVEAQIQAAQDLPREVLASWARGDMDCCGPLKEESLTFLIRHFWQSGQTDLTSDLSSSLNGRIWVRIANNYRRLLGQNAARDLAAEVCSEFWATVLDPRSPQAAWVELCFWTVVMNLAKNYLKRERYILRHVSSFDSNRSTMEFVIQLQSHDIPLDDQIYLQEFLDRLPPMECAALVLRHTCDASVKEIGATVGRSESSVRTFLHRATEPFRDAA